MVTPAADPETPLALGVAKPSEKRGLEDGPHGKEGRRRGARGPPGTPRAPGARFLSRRKLVTLPLVAGRGVRPV